MPDYVQQQQHGIMHTIYYMKKVKKEKKEGHFICIVLPYLVSRNRKCAGDVVFSSSSSRKDAPAKEDKI